MATINRKAEHAWLKRENQRLKKWITDLESACENTTAILCGNHAPCNDIMSIQAASVMRRLDSPEPEPIKYTGDRELAECPCCASLDVGGVGGSSSIEEGTAIVNCYSCGLELRKKGTLKEACASWNMRAGTPQPPAEQSAVPEGYMLAPEEWRERMIVIRSLIANAPEDALGSGHSEYCEPWSIRDEVVDSITKLLKNSRARSLNENPLEVPDGT